MEASPRKRQGQEQTKKKERNNPGRVAKPPEAEGRDKLEASPFRSRSSSASRSRTPRRKRKASIVKEKNQSSMTPSGNHSHGGEKKEAQESSEHRSRRRRSESIRNVDESCRGEIAATHLTFERSCGGPGDGWGGRRGRVLVVGSERREGLELGVVRLDWTPCVPGRQSVSFSFLKSLLMSRAPSPTIPHPSVLHHHRIAPPPRLQHVCRRVYTWMQTAPLPKGLSNKFQS